jgi:hypothetical protein
MKFYNYPENKHVSPFEAVDADNYFAVAGKITCLGTFEEIGNIKTSFDTRNNLLTGAYVLNIFKRYALIENGKLTYLNKKFNDGHEIGASRYKCINYVIYTNILHKYKIDSWGTNFLETYSVNNTDGTYNCSLQFRLFDTPDLAIQYAIEISNNKNMKCIVAQWYADIDRH